MAKTVVCAVYMRRNVGFCHVVLILVGGSTGIGICLVVIIFQLRLLLTEHIIELTTRWELVM